VLLPWKIQLPLYLGYFAYFDVSLESNHFNRFKRDLIRLVANLSFRSEQAATNVLAQGALPLLLSQCRPEPGMNEYLREWSIFCLRNLCESSPDVQVELCALDPTVLLSFAKIFFRRK
jgi:hypothetical protein